jgi:cytoskeletal protein CcmA (bactofilin family)
MFRRKEEKEQIMKEPRHIDTLIGVHSIFTGDLSFEGAVRIDGRFEGNIRSEKDGTLIVSEGAFIKGEVSVPNLVLHGDINGDVHATNSLRIGAKGILNGDVNYKVISLAEGAFVNGRCSHLDENQASAKVTSIKQDEVEVIQVK